MSHSSVPTRKSLSSTSPQDRFSDLQPMWLAALTESSAVTTKAEERQREKLLAGYLNYVHSSENQWVHIGTENIDWEGSHLDQQEWRAQLNRFFHLQDLCRFFLQTGDERYAAVAAAQISDWIRYNPSESYHLAKGDNTLSLAIRCGCSCRPGWLGTLPFFATSEAFTDGLIDSILDSVQAQLLFLQNHLTPMNNWRIAQADNFAFAGLCFPEMRQSSHFLELGVGLLNEGVWRQFEADGSHRERTPHYHNWMASVYFQYWELSRRRPDIGIMIPTGLMTEILQYAVSTCGPDGKEGALQDGHTLTTAGIVQCDLDPFPSKAVLERFCDLTGTERSYFAPQNRFFSDAGQFYLRSRDNTEMLSFDATRWGGPHCHLSRNSVEFYLGKRRLLRDGGIYSYNEHDPFMAYGKSTRSHNTVNLNGWNQSVAAPTRTRAFQQGDQAIVASDYEGGYWSGPLTWSFRQGTGDYIWACHHRTLFWHEARFALVIDSIVRDHAVPGDAPSLECNWQLDSGIVKHEPEKHRAFTADPGERNLLLQFLEFPQGAGILRFEGESFPPRGWLPGPGRIRPAPQISVILPKMHSHCADFCTLMVPFDGEKPPAIKFCLTRPDPLFVTALEIEWENGLRDELEWTQALSYPLGQRPSGTSPASFEHRMFPSGESGPTTFSAFPHCESNCGI